MAVDHEALEELRGAVRGLLSRRSPMPVVRRSAGVDAGTADGDPQGPDPQLWSALVEELGVVGPTLRPEPGAPAWTDLLVVFEELGRALAMAPYFGTVAMALPLVDLGAVEPIRSSLLEEIGAGATAALALAGPDGWTTSWAGGPPPVTAARRHRDWTLRGTTRYVVDGASADHLLVPARTPDDVTALFHVPGAADGVRRTAQAVLDPTRPLATVEFCDVVAEPLADGVEAGAVLRTGLDLAAIALAAEQVGAAERCLELTLEHLRTRHQFGRPIGSFQALKHRCADLFLELESARAAVGHAADVAATGLGTDLAAAASLAKAYCSDVLLLAAREHLQMHGGTGYTWEHDAHLFLRRAKADQLLLGDPSWHRERLLREVTTE